MLSLSTARHPPPSTAGKIPPLRCAVVLALLVAMVAAGSSAQPPAALPIASEQERRDEEPVDRRQQPVDGSEEEGDRPAVASEAVVLDSVTVTASRREKEVFEEPVVVDLVSESDVALRRKVGNFVDTLQELSAVSVQKTAQGQGSPFIRGFTGFLNLMLIDGVRFNNSVLRSGPNQYWATIDPLTASRVELVKGPGSMLYGPDAVGGTVNLLTAATDLTSDGLRSVDGRIYLRGATAESSGIGRVEVGGSSRRRLAWLAGGSLKSYGDLEAGGGTGRVENSAYGEGGADFKLQFLPRDDRQWTFLFQHFRQNEVPRTETTIFSKPFRGTRAGSELRRDHDQKRSLAYVRFRHLQGGGAITDAEYTLSYQRHEEDRIRVRGDRRSDLSGLDVDTLGFQGQFRSPTLSWGRLTYGIEYYRDAVDSYRTDFNADGTVRRVRIQGPVGDDASYDLLGIYLQDELSLARDRISLTLGGRYSYQALDAGRVEDPETGEEIAVDGAWSKVVGSARVLWRPDPRGADRWRLFASAAQSFRAPNLSDLTAFDATSAIETPTPDLEPESYLSFELGSKYRSPRLDLTASFFHTVISDQIVQSPTGRFIDGTPEVQKSNVGDGYLQGIEALASWQGEEGVGLWGNLTWMEGRVDQFLFDSSGGADKVRAPVSRLIPWMGNAGARYRPPGGRWWVELHGTAYSKADKLALRDLADTRRIPPGGTPGFAVFGLRGAVELFDGGLTLAAGIENLLDEDYRIHGSGQNMPGRNLVVSLDWRP